MTEGSASEPARWPVAKFSPLIAWSANVSKEKWFCESDGKWVYLKINLNQRQTLGMTRWQHPCLQRTGRLPPPPPLQGAYKRQRHACCQLSELFQSRIAKICWKTCYRL